MKKAIRDHARDFAAHHRRSSSSRSASAATSSPTSGCASRSSRTSRSTIKAEFSTAQAVTPGQGQTVRVSGVKIGDVGKVELKEGRALVTLEIDPEYKDLVREDATALLRPKTALKDMFIEVEPGDAPAPVAKEGYVIPVAQHAARRQPRRVPLDARRRHARVPAAARQRRGPGPQGPRRRPQRGVQGVRADAPRPRARDREGRRAAREPAPAHLEPQRAQRRAGRQGRRPRAARRLGVARVPRVRVGGHQHHARRSTSCPRRCSRRRRR